MNHLRRINWFVKVDTTVALWLAENAHNYGFILRYPVGKEDITGYVDEWWHYRYVGKDLAQQIHDSELTMEEFFNVSGGDYE